jgi:arginase
MLLLRENTRAIQFIGAANSLGTKQPGCARAPAAVRATGLERRITDGGAVWGPTIEGVRATGETLSDAIARFSITLADQVEATQRAGDRFVVIGGDHSSAIGAWSGAARGLRDDGPLGLIWIDAHLDSHTPETTPSGQVHGMPVASLLGRGDATLAGIAGSAPTLAPDNLCLIGTRSFESEELALLTGLGVRIFPMAEIRSRGLAPVMRDAIAIAGTGTAGVGVSIDVDVLDPDAAPAVGSPVPEGLGIAELSDALRLVSRLPRLIGCEIAEFNPELDGAAPTVSAVESLLVAMLVDKI